MKITASLKISFIAAMVLIGTVTALLFSALALNYFFSGLDMGTNHSMRFTLAAQAPIPDNTVVNANGFIISDNWSLLPEQLHQHLSPPQEYGVLSKQTINNSLFRPPEKVLLAMKLKDISGQPVYIGTIFSNVGKKAPPGNQFVHPQWIVLLGFIVLIIFILLTLAFIRWVTRPVLSLGEWAGSLDNCVLDIPPPDFKYRELNTLADIIHRSMKSVQESVEREQQFLSHASHELRTPIAVTRTNSELLEKVMQKEGSSHRQQEILARIMRANKTMTDLTDTLLWLSRDSDNTPVCQPLDLAALTRVLTDEVGYLLEGKPVQVHLSTEPALVSVAAIPCRIALINLIRNACQHTLEGDIRIEQRAGRITITNDTNDAGDEVQDLGFGLGQKLTQKIADVYGWHYHAGRTGDHYYAELEFPTVPSDWSVQS